METSIILLLLSPIIAVIVTRIVPLDTVILRARFVERPILNECSKEEYYSQKKYRVNCSDLLRQISNIILYNTTIGEIRESFLTMPCIVEDRLVTYIYIKEKTIYKYRVIMYPKGNFSVGREDTINILTEVSDNIVKKYNLNYKKGGVGKESKIVIK